MLESIALVGLDVHQAQSVAAVLDPVSGELRVERLRGAPGDVVPVFLEGLGRAVRAVYEAGPTGFALARAAAARGLDLRVVSPGSIPKAPGDRVKTDRRDAKRLVRLFAAGELSFSFVPSEEEEHFRDLVRCIDDARQDLMRSRHRLSKFLLRRGLRFPGRAWTQPARGRPSPPRRVERARALAHPDRQVDQRHPLVAAEEPREADRRPARAARRSPTSQQTNVPRVPAQRGTPVALPAREPQRSPERTSTPGSPGPPDPGSRRSLSSPARSDATAPASSPRSASASTTDASKDSTAASASSPTAASASTQPTP
jgi:Transposase